MISCDIIAIPFLLILRFAVKVNDFIFCKSMTVLLDSHVLCCRNDFPRLAQDKI